MRFKKGNSISILCRGKSLGSVNLMPICDTLILVNAFHRELEYIDISNYVKKHSNVIHMVAIGSQFHNMIERGDYQKYNFKKIVLPYIKECIPEVIPLERNLNIVERKDGIVRIRTILSAEYAHTRTIESSFLSEIKNKLLMIWVLRK